MVEKMQNIYHLNKKQTRIIQPPYLLVSYRESVQNLRN